MPTLFKEVNTQPTQICAFTKTPNAINTKHE